MKNKLDLDFHFYFIKHQRPLLNTYWALAQEETVPHTYPNLKVYTVEAGSRSKMCLMSQPSGGNVMLNLSNTEQRMKRS